MNIWDNFFAYVVGIPMFIFVGIPVIIYELLKYTFF